MLMTARIRRFVTFLLSALLVTSAVAPASVDLATGIRRVVTTGTLDDCNGKASAALAAYLHNVTSPTPGEWIGNGPITATDTTAAGTIHCYAHAGGYVVTKRMLEMFKASGRPSAH